MTIPSRTVVESLFGHNDTPVIIPKATDSVRDHAWTTVRVCNETSFNLYFENVHLECGTFWQKPGDVASFGERTFSACTWTKGSTLTGANGIAGFTLLIPGQGSDYEEISLSIGFSQGKAGITTCFSSFTPTEGHHSATVVPGYELSEPFTARSSDGNQSKLLFLLASVPGEEAVITLTQEYANIP